MNQAYEYGKKVRDSDIGGYPSFGFFFSKTTQPIWMQQLLKKSRDIALSYDTKFKKIESVNFVYEASEDDVFSSSILYISQEIEN